LFLDGVEIPAGITLLINFYTLHRRPDVWGDDAEEFNPDHFLPENVEKRHPYSFLPFSGGQRNCIGELRGESCKREGFVRERCHIGIQKDKKLFLKDFD
jgi:hypothetical protein